MCPLPKLRNLCGLLWFWPRPAIENLSAEHDSRRKSSVHYGFHLRVFTGRPLRPLTQRTNLEIIRALSNSDGPNQPKANGTNIRLLPSHWYIVTSQMPSRSDTVPLDTLWKIQYFPEIQLLSRLQTIDFPDVLIEKIRNILFHQQCCFSLFEALCSSSLEFLTLDHICCKISTTRSVSS